MSSEYEWSFLSWALALYLRHLGFSFPGLCIFDKLGLVGVRRPEKGGQHNSNLWFQYSIVNVPDDDKQQQNHRKHCRSCRSLRMINLDSFLSDSLSDQGIYAAAEAASKIDIVSPWTSQDSRWTHLEQHMCHWFRNNFFFYVLIIFSCLFVVEKYMVFTHLNVDDVVHRYEDIQSWKKL